jgi:exodeoxyribonuclease V gamma subunit
MPGFHLYRSSSTQRLADTFVQMITAPGAALPIEQDEWVVVQGRGMERWLSQRAAEQLGVWAGAQFPYPRSAAAQLAARVLGEPLPAREIDDSLLLAFAVAAELPEIMSSPVGARVRAYVGNDSARLLSFAQQAARALDGYLVFRPLMLDAWGAGTSTDEDAHPDAAWQAALWRAVRRRAIELQAHNPALANMVDFWPRVRRATQALEQGAACPGVQRLSAFAVASVPPQMVDFFAALGRTCDVHWFAVDPAAETKGSPAPLVASLGLADLEAVHVVQEAMERAARAGVVTHQQVLAVEAEHGNAHALALLQAHARTAESAAPAEHPDCSLRVHACPGAMREAEVMHDELLRAFDELPGLSCEDIVVLVPDIGAYAPVIEAVLRGGRGVPAPGGLAKLASSVADISDRDGSPMAVALSTALSLADGDMDVRHVTEFLGQPLMAEKFLPQSLSPRDMARWLIEAGARRFLNAEHRASAGVPFTDECTWEHALDRLYAGLAAPAGTVAAEPHSQLYPARPFLLRAESLGQVSSFVAVLADLRQLAFVADEQGALVARHVSIPHWMDRLRRLLQQLAPRSGDAERESRELAQQLAQIERAALAAEWSAPVGFAAVRTLVMEQLLAGKPGRGFLAGGVTVCQFVPMRAVPFRMVCMLGMDDERFPRPQSRLGFDLLGHTRQLGDRDARAEDRALFLECVLGADQRLMIAYSARDLVTGARRAPSTAVAELMDCAQLKAVEHPLHAFSVGSFDSAAERQDRVGYDASARVAAGRLLQGVTSRQGEPFLVTGDTQRVAGSSSVMQPQSVVTLEELTRFFRDPAAATLRAWDVRLPGDESAAPQIEPLVMDHWDMGVIRRRVLLAAMQGAEPLNPQVTERLQQDGLLPIGSFGRFVGLEQQHLVSDALQRMYPAGVQLAPIDIRIGSWRVMGQVPTQGGVSAIVESGSQASHRTLSAWIHHLALAAARGGVDDGLLHTAADAKSLKLPACDGALATDRLQALLALREFGLARGLPFFVALSLEGASALAKGEPEWMVIDSARDGRDDDRKGLSPHAKLLWRGLDPFTAHLGYVPGVCRATYLDVARAVTSGLHTTGGQAT